jgi:HEAT repeat protein
MMSMSRRLLVLLVLALAAGTRAAPAQQQAAARTQSPVRLPGAVSVEEATQITNGWALLAQGLYEQAAAKAAQVLAAHPRSGTALILAVEVDIARSGARAGLTQYERWLGQRKWEEPLVLRRVAQAVLREEAAQQQDQTARVEALRALADEGEPGAARELAAVAAGGQGATRALASQGDERAVRELIAGLDKEPAGGVAAMEALGASQSPLAVAPLVERLGDSRTEVRGAAAQALGKLGDTRAVAPLTPLLSDSSAYVRAKAAGALVRLGDNAGVPLLQEMMTDPAPTTRIVAVEEMASRPDSAWIAVTRELTAAPEAEVRAVAGRLIAPYDPELSRSVLDALATNPNPAIRELVSREQGEVVTDNLAALRGLLKSSDRLTRVRGAARVMALTR